MSNADQAFLWAYDIGADGTIATVDQAAITTPVAPNTYRWVHLQSDESDAEQLLDTLALPSSVADSLMALQTRPRVLPIKEGALIFLRGINANPGADPDDMVSLRLWLTPNLMVTARRQNRRLMSVQDTREMIESGEAPATTAELLVTLLTRIADRIHDKIEDIDEQLAQYETADALNKQDRQQLAMLRRQTAIIRRHLAPQRDALDTLIRLPNLINDSLIFELRDQADRMTRYVEDLDLARERSLVLQDELRNQIADQQGIRMYVLSMITAIFLPLSFLTGVFGMNVAGLPGTEAPDAFTTLMMAMGGIAVVMLIAMLWKRWL
ncbi:transporter [Alteromonas sp. I4]|nr:transporter [Alteromonas sp. I4]